MAFGRDYSLVIGPTGDIAATAAGALDVSGLRCVFAVRKTLKPEPNTAEVKIYNLKADNRMFLESASKLVVRVEAGYKDTGTSQIYLGELRTAHSVKEGPDVCTYASTGDGEKELATKRIRVPIGPGASAETALRAMINALGLDAGNLSSALKALSANGITTLHPLGGVLSGYVARELTDFCRSAGLEWSIQDGAVQILGLGKGLGGKSLVLSAATGLLGSPTVDSKGVATATVMMLPGIKPGAVVVFDAKYLKGAFRLTTCEYNGDTHGQDWQVKITGKKY